MFHLLNSNLNIYLKALDVTQAIEAKIACRPFFLVKHYHIYCAISLKDMAECARLLFFSFRRKHEPSERYIIRALLDLDRI